MENNDQGLRNFRSANLAGADLAGKNLAKCDLRSADLVDRRQFGKQISRGVV